MQPPTSIHVHTLPTHWPEKRWILGIWAKQMGVSFELVAHTTSDYAFHLPNGTTIRMADVFFGQCTDDTADVVSEDVSVEANAVQPSAYSSRNLPKAHIKIQPTGSESTYHALYGTDHFSVQNDTVTLGADLIGTAFFMLTRIEEALQPELHDHLGRLDAPHHAAVRFDLSNTPFLDAYPALFQELAQDLGYHLQLPKLPSSWQLSCDIDTPLQWLAPTQHRLLTALSALVNRRDAQEAMYWWRYPGSAADAMPVGVPPKDPCDTYGHLMDIAEAAGHRCMFYMLGERPKDSDHYYSLEHGRVQDIIERIEMRGHGIGFHPSIAAHKDAAQFQREYDSLQSVVIQSITHVRTHYLCGAYPSTWRMMEACGLQHDSSLGYHTQAGFRCGTAQAYPLFDIDARREMGVTEQPLIAMDVALMAAKRQQRPAEIGAVLYKLTQKVQQTGGVMTLLWHNSSFLTHRWYPYAVIPYRHMQLFQ